MDAAARTAGHAVVETGTHVEILGEQSRWWPGTIMGREEGSGGRLVHAVEYNGYPHQEFRLNLEEETWRRAICTLSYTPVLRLSTAHPHAASRDISHYTLHCIAHKKLSAVCRGQKRRKCPKKAYREFVSGCRDAPLARSAHSVDPTERCAEPTHAPSLRIPERA